jgi:hypothetical protein
MPQDRLPPPLKPADAALETAVRQAVLEEDTARAMDMMRGHAFSEEFRNDILGGVMGLADDVGFVRFLVEELDTEMTATRCVFLLNAACRKNLADTTVYLVERALAENISRHDCYSRIFSNFSAEGAAEVVQKLAEKTDDRAAAMTEAMLDAALVKSYGALGALVDAGAVADKHMPIVLLSLMMCQDEAFYNDKEKYLETVQKVLQTATPQNLAALDLVLPIAAYKIPDQAQYPEVLEMLVNAGADPFAMKGEVVRALTKAFNDRGDFAAEEHWKNYLSKAQENYTAKYSAQFDEKFANGFSIEDLQKIVNAAGDTGLTLAARARRADVVLDVAVKDGGLTLAAMFNQVAGEKSTVSLAIDRGDLAQWIRPSYWLKQDPQILKAIEEKLTEEQKKWAELDVLAAKIDQHKLKQSAGRFKLTPKR